MTAGVFGTQKLRVNLIDAAQQATSYDTAPYAATVGSIGIDTSTVLPRTWLKTSTPTSGWTIQNLHNLRVYNAVRDFGFVRDGVTNNDAMAKTAIATMSAAGGGILYFPPGNYAFQRPAPPNVWNFELNGVTDIFFLGDGPASKLLMTGSSGLQDYYLFYVHGGSKRIRFYNLGFDGLSLTNISEQDHIIRIRGAASDAVGPTDVEVVGCWFFGQPGDGIQILGESAKEVTNVRIVANALDCVSSRSGIGIQRATGRIIISHNWLSGPHDQEIDFEPTGLVGNFEFNIHCNQTHNVSNSALSCTFTGDGPGATSHKRSVIASNVIRGSVDALNLQNVDMIGNVFVRDVEGNVDPDLGTGRPQVKLFRYIEGLTYTANIARYIVAASAVDVTPVYIFGVGGSTLPSKVHVSNSIADSTRGPTGFVIESAYEVLVAGCIARMTPTAVNTAVGFNLRAIEGLGDHQTVRGSMALTGGLNLLTCVNFSASPGSISNSTVSGCMVINAFSIARWTRGTTEPIFGSRIAQHNLGVITNAGIEVPADNTGAVVSTLPMPYVMTNGDTLTVAVNGGAPQTITFSCTQAQRTGVAGTYPTGFVGGEALTVNIDATTNQSIVFTAADQALVDVINRINGVLTTAVASNSGGQLRITSNRCGLGSRVQVVGGTAAATLGMAVGSTSGTGNVSDILNVSSKEVGDAATTTLAGGRGGGSILLTNQADGTPVPARIWTTTSGNAGSIQVTGGTANALIGFPTGVVVGASVGVTAGGNAGLGRQIALMALAAGPQNNVTAPIGSALVNSSGGQATVLWTKEAAANNTGWASVGGFPVTFGTVDTDAAVTAARFMAPGFGQALVGTTEIQLNIPRACIIRNLRMHCTAGVGAGNTVYTMRKNGASTGLVLTVAHTASSGSSASASISFAAGDLLSMQVTKSALPGTAQTNVLVTLELI